MLKFFGFKSDIGVKNWYQDRIRAVTIQRNFFLLVIGLSFAALLIALVTLFTVTRSKSIEPFVIEVSKQSGITTIVNPVTVKEYSANRAISNYFAVNYIKARETFDPNTYKYNFYTVVRLLSNPNVYNEFRYLLRVSNQDSPFNLYSNVSTSSLKVRSIQYLYDNSIQIRFSVEFEEQNKSILKNKIALLNFDYKLLEMNDEERYVNPLGFIVTSYKVDDDNV